MRLARAGEAHAFDQLVERYLRGALAVALEYARDRDEAEDIVQDAFIRLLRGMDRFDDRLAFRPWFYTIVRNLGRNAAGQRARVSDSTVETMVAPAVSDAAADAELRQLIDRELSGMTELQSASFRLCDIEGFSAAEVADMLGIGVATVRTHAHRARIKLREVLARKGYGSPT